MEKIFVQETTPEEHKILMQTMREILKLPKISSVGSFWYDPTEDDIFRINKKGLLKLRGQVLQRQDGVFIIETGYWIENYDADIITKFFMIDFNLKGKKIELVKSHVLDEE